MIIAPPPFKLIHLFICFSFQACQAFQACFWWMELLIDPHSPKRWSLRLAHWFLWCENLAYALTRLEYLPIFATFLVHPDNYRSRTSNSIWLAESRSQPQLKGSCVLLLILPQLYGSCVLLLILPLLMILHLFLRLDIG